MGPYRLPPSGCPPPPPPPPPSAADPCLCRLSLPSPCPLRFSDSLTSAFLTPHLLRDVFIPPPSVFMAVPSLHVSKRLLARGFFCGRFPPSVCKTRSVFSGFLPISMDPFYHSMVTWPSFYGRVFPVSKFPDFFSLGNGDLGGFSPVMWLLSFSLNCDSGPTWVPTSSPLFFF